VPYEDLDRIGPRLSVRLDDDHRLAVVEPVDRVRARELRRVDRGNAVLRRPSGLELAEGHERLREVGLPLCGVGRRRRSLAEPDERPFLLDELVDLRVRLRDLLFLARRVRAAAAGEHQSGPKDCQSSSPMRHPAGHQKTPKLSAPVCAPTDAPTRYRSTARTSSAPASL
jgi:hypothetical protein